MFKYIYIKEMQTIVLIVCFNFNCEIHAGNIISKGSSKNSVHSIILLL